MAKTRKEKGFILVILLSLLLLLAVTAMSLNFKSGMQANMAANRTVDTQTYFDQLAVIKQSVWKLTQDASWRVPAGESYAYQGRTYSRTATNSAISSPADYRDVVTISVRAPDATRTVKKSFRYYIDTPFSVRKPRQVVDIAGKIYFADTDNHSVWKIDALSGAIIRVAGTGMSGFSGDGGPANQAKLNNPNGVWVDAAGNIYIADTNNNRIRKVTAGSISTVVNTAGSSGFSGDGGLATAATLKAPSGVSVDAAGNIYIADTDNNAIRKVTAATGIITTVVNTAGIAGFSGDGGLATAARLKTPLGVSVDAAGNIYIADTKNNAIRKVTAATGIITTVVNTAGSSGFSGDGGLATAATLKTPSGVSVDAAGNIYIADTDNNAIRKVTAATGIITTVVNTAGIAGFSGDGGLATAARLKSPLRVSVDAAGNLYVSDTGNHALRRVNNPGAAINPGAISTMAGTGSSGYNGDNQPAIQAQLNSPAGAALGQAKGGGRMFIGDSANNRIRMLFLKTVKEVYGP